MCTLWLAESSTISMHVLVFRRELEEEEETPPPQWWWGNHMLSEQWCTLNSRYRYELASKQLLIILTSDVIIFSCNDNIIDLNFTAPACMGPSHGDGGEIIIYIAGVKLKLWIPTSPEFNQRTFLFSFLFFLESIEYGGRALYANSKRKLVPIPRFIIICVYF